MDITPEVREAINNYKTYHRDDFIEKNFSVVNKDMKVVPLIPTLAQRYYWRTRTPRDIYLKARQVRISTIAHADVISESMVKPGLNSLIIAQKPEDETLGPIVHEQDCSMHKPRTSGSQNLLPTQRTLCNSAGLMKNTTSPQQAESTLAHQEVLV